MIVVRGVRERKDGRLRVYLEEENGPEGAPRVALKPRNDIFNHSPTGFECGYEGSGPAQLALAVLCAALEEMVPNPDAIALRLHQDFKRDVIAKISREVKTWAFSLAWVREKWLPERIREIERHLDEEVIET